MAILISSTTTSAVFASGYSPSDIDTNPERLCLNKIDEPEWKDLCDWINICDDTGEVDSTHGYCTGYAVSNPPGSIRCPPGFHSTDDDETGLCYKSIGPTGCEYEHYLLRPDNKTCGEIIPVCMEYPDQKGCKVTADLSTPENKDGKCERNVPDYCFEPYKESQTLSNGTFVLGTSLQCGDINVTDFRVTIRDEDRHNFDGDYDGIGCEKAFNDVQRLIWGDS